MIVVRAVRSFLRLLVFWPEDRRHWYNVVLWWELRRIPYNLIAATLGLSMIFLAVYIVECVPPRPQWEDWDIGLSAMAAAIFWNFVYTGGWMCEMIARSRTRREMRWLSLAMFSLGLMLTLAFPILVLVSETCEWLYRLVTGAPDLGSIC